MILFVNNLRKKLSDLEKKEKTHNAKAGLAHRTVGLVVEVVAEACRAEGVAAVGRDRLPHQLAADGAQELLFVLRERFHGEGGGTRLAAALWGKKGYK